MRGFVVGPIGDQLAPAGNPARKTYEDAIQVFEEIIIAAWLVVGLDREDLSRADELDRPGEVTEQVMREVLEADLVIADLSGANPNAMYELGLRHAAAKPTIQIGEYGHLPFDVSVIRTIIFSRSPNGLINGRDKLVRAIQAVIRGEGELPTASRVFGELICVPGGGAPATRPSTPPSEEPPEVTPEELEEPPGFMELIADMETAMPEMTERLQAMTATTGEVGELASEYTDRLNRQTTAGARLAVVNSFAKELEPLARKLDRDSVEFAARMTTVGSGLDAIFALVREDSSRKDEVREMLDSVVTMGESALEAIGGVRGFRDSAAQIQKAARGVRPVIRLLVSALDRTLGMFDRVTLWASDARTLLDQAGREPTPPL